MTPKGQRGRGLAVALLVVGLLIGAGIGYLVAPRSQAPSPGDVITIPGSTVHLSVLSGPGLSFAIGGLVNPTIQVTPGAQIMVHFLNIATIPHSFAIVAQGPPYASEPPSEVAFSGAESPDAMMGTTSGGNATFSFTAGSAGTYWYLCHVPGHATGGMYGKFVVQA